MDAFEKHCGVIQDVAGGSVQCGAVSVNPERGMMLIVGYG